MESHEISERLAQGFSEYWKQLANDPVRGLIQVNRHVGEKGLRDVSREKSKLLRRLVELRECKASARPTRFIDKESETAETSTAAEIGKATNALDRLTERVQVLRQRVEIMGEIHHVVVKNPGKKKGEAADFLPLGIGQHLDNSLLSGEMDIDSYAENITRLAKTFSDMQEQEKQREKSEKD